jgi:hypothetical protein
MVASLLANFILWAISLIGLNPVFFFTALLGIKIGNFLAGTEAAVTPAVFGVVGK